MPREIADWRELVPETRPRLATIERTTDARLGAGHFVLLYDDVASGRYTNVTVNAEYLAISSQFPVIVEVDGVPVNLDEDIVAVPSAGSVGPNNWAIQYEGADQLNLRLRPGMSYTLRRRVGKLSVKCTGDLTDYTDSFVHGCVHLFVGSGGVEDMGFGLPVPHTIELPYAGAATSAVNYDLRPTLHGNNAASPGSALKYVLSREEIIGVAVVPTWAGAAGLITSLTLAQQTSGADVVLTRYRPQVAAVDFDFGVPVELAGYHSRRFDLDLRGVLKFTVTTSADVTALAVTLRCRGWL